MKTVAIQRGLEKFIAPLKEKGFKTVFIEQATDEPIYAYLYLEDSFVSNEMLNWQLNNSFISANTESNGVLLINAKSKTADDIIAILEKRTYSPLF